MYEKALKEKEKMEINQTTKEIEKNYVIKINSRRDNFQKKNERTRAKVSQRK